AWKKLILSVGMFHRSRIAESHAREQSIAQESRNLARWRGPPLRNCKIPRAAAAQHPETAESRARERSIARELRNPTRGKGLSLRNRGILSAGEVLSNTNTG